MNKKTEKILYIYLYLRNKTKKYREQSIARIKLVFSHLVHFIAWFPKPWLRLMLNILPLSVRGYFWYSVFSHTRTRSSNVVFNTFSFLLNNRDFSPIPSESITHTAVRILTYT